MCELPVINVLFYFKSEEKGIPVYQYFLVNRVRLTIRVQRRTQDRRALIVHSQYFIEKSRVKSDFTKAEKLT